MNRYRMTILKTGFFAGLADILLAFADAWWSNGISAVLVLRFIASALMGNAAFGQQPGPVLLGLAIHFFIAYFWTGVFFMMFPHFKKIVGSPFWQGIVYGIFIWLVMNLLVLPLTNAPVSAFKWWPAMKGMIILIMAVGWPLAYSARNYYLKKQHSHP